MAFEHNPNCPSVPSPVNIGDACTEPCEVRNGDPGARSTSFQSLPAGSCGHELFDRNTDSPCNLSQHTTVQCLALFNL
jgi:hypothetical protein